MLLLFGLFLGTLFWIGLYWIGIWVAGAGVAMFACQCFMYVLNGYWTSWNFRETLITTGLGDLPNNMGGMTSVVRWLAALPLTLEVIVIGLLIAWVGARGQASAKIREARRRQIH